MDNYRYVAASALDDTQVQFAIAILSNNPFLRFSLLNARDTAYVDSLEIGSVVGFFQDGVDRGTARIAAVNNRNHGLQLEAQPSPALNLGQMYEVRFTQARPSEQIASEVGAGNDGWSPVISGVSDGVRRVLRVSDWTGGTGTKPALGYIGVNGLVSDIANGVDIGLAGPRGSLWKHGTAFPTSPSNDDYFLFTAAVASGLTWYADETTSAVKTDAALGDIGVYNGTRWVYEGNIRGAAGGLNQAQVDARIEAALVPVNTRIATNVSFIVSGATIPTTAYPGQILIFVEARTGLVDFRNEANDADITTAAVGDRFQRVGDKWVKRTSGTPGTSDIIDLRTTYRDPAADGSEDLKLAIRNDGLYRVKVRQTHTTNPTATFAAYGASDYEGVHDTHPDVTAVGKRYFNSGSLSWFSSVQFGDGSYGWVHGSPPTSWEGVFTSQADALAHISGNGIAYTGSEVETVSNYTAGATTTYTRTWVHADQNTVDVGGGVSQASLEAEIQARQEGDNTLTSRVANLVKYIYSGTAIPVEAADGDTLWFRAARASLVDFRNEANDADVTAAAINDIFQRVGDKWVRRYRASTSPGDGNGDTPTTVTGGYKYIFTVDEITDAPTLGAIIKLDADMTLPAGFEDGNDNAVTEGLKGDVFVYLIDTWARVERAPSAASPTEEIGTGNITVGSDNILYASGITPAANQMLDNQFWVVNVDDNTNIYDATFLVSVKRWKELTAATANSIYGNDNSINIPVSSSQDVRIGRTAANEILFGATTGSIDPMPLSVFLLKGGVDTDNGNGGAAFTPTKANIYGVVKEILHPNDQHGVSADDANNEIDIAIPTEPKLISQFSDIPTAPVNGEVIIFDAEVSGLLAATHRFKNTRGFDTSSAEERDVFQFDGTFWQERIQGLEDPNLVISPTEREQVRILDLSSGDSVTIPEPTSRRAGIMSSRIYEQHQHNIQELNTLQTLDNIAHHTTDGSPEPDITYNDANLLQGYIGVYLKQTLPHSTPPFTIPNEFPEQRFVARELGRGDNDDVRKNFVHLQSHVDTWRMLIGFRFRIESNVNSRYSVLHESYGEGSTPSIAPDNPIIMVIGSLRTPGTHRAILQAEWNATTSKYKLFGMRKATDTPQTVSTSIQRTFVSDSLGRSRSPLELGGVEGSVTFNLPAHPPANEEATISIQVGGRLSGAFVGENASETYLSIGSQTADFTDSPLSWRIQYPSLNIAITLTGSATYTASNRRLVVSFDAVNLADASMIIRLQRVAHRAIPAVLSFEKLYVKESPTSTTDLEVDPDEWHEFLGVFKLSDLTNATSDLKLQSAIHLDGETSAQTLGFADLDYPETEVEFNNTLVGDPNGVSVKEIQVGYYQDTTPNDSLPSDANLLTYLEEEASEPFFGLADYTYAPSAKISSTVDFAKLKLNGNMVLGEKDKIVAGKTENAELEVWEDFLPSDQAASSITLPADYKDWRYLMLWCNQIVNNPEVMGRRFDIDYDLSVDRSSSKYQLRVAGNTDVTAWNPITRVLSANRIVGAILTGYRGTT